MIEQIVPEEVARRVHAGFGSADEVWRSGHITAYWLRLKQMEAETACAEYMRAIQKGDK